MLRRRFYSTGYTGLKETLKTKIPETRQVFAHLKKNANVKIGEITIGGTIGGMRGYNALLWQSSKVDPNKGVTFHGKTIEQVQAELPSNGEILPESMFWFLLTGEVPSEQQVAEFSKELVANAALPDYVVKVLDSLPSTLHPMTQLSIGISTLNNESEFAKKYAAGLRKDEYWEPAFHDSLNLISKLPALIGKIYSNTYHGGKTLGEIDYSKDWSYNLSQLLGFTTTSTNIQGLNESQSNDFVNLTRLYCALHGDHEGGNVSSHATHLVGSALSDPFLSYSAGIQGLAGPLHGLAAQEVVRFIEELHSKAELTDAGIEEYLWSILNSKRVIPGYGHGVLRQADPRFTAMLRFAQERSDEFAKDEYFQIVEKLSHIAPPVLIKHGKTKNPYPNVDSSSGVLFYHYGLRETLFYTVIFGASRALGPLSQLIWDRALGLPIERPQSETLESLLSHLK